MSTSPLATSSLLTVAEAALSLRVSESTIRRLVRNRRIGVVHVAAAVRISPDELARFQRDNERPAL
ncbi:helix-turn-helix domain-containing protein [Microbacterium sp. T32]|uniref:helix-turn-helix domain-containing protein n=1 Tax=Microbacterium sp. T32 TaxID=1776083 RepID=UPI0007AB2A06|nr:helix-turn-helix domain-containing protein [Microbacterium sp. T32]KZE33089.1 hypothetical protein AVW09_06820 [Microbacterium sp. T32]